MCQQFIVLHYCLTNRDDRDFWQEAAKKADYCPELKSLLDVWQYKICEFHDLAGKFSTTFTDENYRYILYGMQKFPDLRQQISSTEAQSRFADLKQNANRAVEASLSHAEILQMLSSVAVKI